MIPKVFNQVIELGDGRTITLETGKLAKQADGSVVVRMGDTIVVNYEELDKVQKKLEAELRKTKVEKDLETSEETREPTEEEKDLFEEVEEEEHAMTPDESRKLHYGSGMGMLGFLKPAHIGWVFGNLRDAAIDRLRGSAPRPTSR